MVIIDGFPLDCTLTEEHNYESEATTYPVESGAEITDHIRPRPTIVNIEGIVTDTPLETVAALRPNKAARTIEIENPDGETEIVPVRELKYSHLAIDHMLEIHESREPVKLETAIKTYKRMVMTSFSPKKQGDSVHITATFQEVIFVTNRRTVIKVAVPQHAKKKVIVGATVTLRTKDKQRVEGEVTNLQSKGQNLIEVRQPGDNKPIARNPTYYRPDGTVVSQQEYYQAIRDAGAVPIGADGKPIDPKDYQPYVPKKQRPAWYQNQPSTSQVPVGKATRLVK